MLNEISADEENLVNVFTECEPDRLIVSETSMLRQLEIYESKFAYVIQVIIFII